MAPDASDRPTAAPPSAAVVPNLECRASLGDLIYELFLEWDGNVARGSLRTSTGARATTQAVQAELYKGLVLVNSPNSRGSSRIATVQEAEKRRIQVGDWKEPWLSCE
jgi:hypothetical protein